MTHERSSPEVLRLSEHFEWDGVEVSYSKERCLPPDAVGVEMGREVARVIEFLRLKSADPNQPVRVLELGTGSGVCEAALLTKVRNPSNIVLTGIDIDPEAVEMTHLNIARAAKKRGCSMQNHNLFQADWYEPKLWDYLAENTFHAILFNPPYLADGTVIRQGYEQTPRHALYAPGDGLEHHRQILPRLFSVLDSLEGSTLITRMPLAAIDPEGQMRRQQDEVLDSAVDSRQAGPMVRFTRIFKRVEDRNNSTVTFTRGSDLNHLGGVLDIAMQANLTSWPETDEAIDEAVALIVKMRNPPSSP